MTNIEEFKRMIIERQMMWERLAKNAGTSGKRSHGQRAAECAAIVGEINKLMGMESVVKTLIETWHTIEAPMVFFTDPEEDKAEIAKYKAAIELLIGWYGTADEIRDFKNSS